MLVFNMKQILTDASTREILEYLWTTLSLPQTSLKSLQLRGGDSIVAPSSFKIGHLAQSSIALSGLLAATIYALRSNQPVPRTVVDRNHAVTEFHSEHLYLVKGDRPPVIHAPIGGLHKTLDGYIRVHDNFEVHRNAALSLVDCSRHDHPLEFRHKVAKGNSLELEGAAAENGGVVYAMRNYADWDATPQAQAVHDFPIQITKIAASEPCSKLLGTNNFPQCLSGIRVLEMSRIIAAPVAGKTLSAHGADVLWVTSPKLPSLPALDMDVGRGKRTAHLDINQHSDRAKLLTLLQDADVFLQSYRPGSLAGKGFDVESVLEDRKGKPLIYANLSAWSTEGPWSTRRGFDSIVQTVSGMNVSEAEHFGQTEPRPMPCQALDHGAGYFLASGIMTALYRQMTEGGSYRVDVSLAGVSKFLRSLGQYEGDSGFQCPKIANLPIEYAESRDCAFGKLYAVRHTVKIDGVKVYWEEMPKPLGSDEAIWKDCRTEWDADMPTSQKCNRATTP